MVLLNFAYFLMRKKLFRFHILLFTFISLWSQAQVIRVAPTPSGSGNGSSWANASSLQNAIANANANNQIWVKRGTYLISGTLNPDLYNLHIYGGLQGMKMRLTEEIGKITSQFSMGRTP